MNGIQVNGTHLMQHFVDDGPDAAGSGLQTGHCVVVNRRARTEINGVFKRGVVAPDAIGEAGIFFLAFGRVENHEAINRTIAVQIVRAPINVLSDASHHLFCE